MRPLIEYAWEKACIDILDLEKVKESAGKTTNVFFTTLMENGSSAAIDKIIEDEVGFVFEKVLEDCGVFKWNEDGKKAMNKYMNDLKFCIEKVKEHEM